MMVTILTIIHLPEGSAQPAVYMIQLGGTSPLSLRAQTQQVQRLGRHVVTIPSLRQTRGDHP